MLIDVVYNHLGPEGNYLADFGPYFTSVTRRRGAKRSTTTGLTPIRCALTSATMRSLGCTDFHVDGLRFDAIHTIFDIGRATFLEETSAALHEQRARARAARAHHRRERSQRRSRHPARRAETASASTHSGATTSTTPSSPR